MPFSSTGTAFGFALQFRQLLSAIFDAEVRRPYRVLALITLAFPFLSFLAFAAHCCECDIEAFLDVLRAGLMIFECFVAFDLVETCKTFRLDAFDQILDFTR